MSACDTLMNFVAGKREDRPSGGEETPVTLPCIYTKPCNDDLPPSAVQWYKEAGAFKPHIYTAEEIRSQQKNDVPQLQGDGRHRERTATKYRTVSRQRLTVLLLAFGSTSDTIHLSLSTAVYAGH